MPKLAPQAGRLLLERVQRLSAAARDFAFETTLASRTFAPWLKELQARGYVLHLVFLWLPSAELALARVAQRVRRSGHAIEEKTVRRRHARSLENFHRLYTRLASTWLMMDNSSPHGPRVMARGSAGGAAGEELLERMAAAAAVAVQQAVRRQSHRGMAGRSGGVDCAGRYRRY